MQCRLIASMALSGSLCLAVRLSLALSGSLWLTLALSGSLSGSPWLSLALSGSPWLSLALSGSLWLSLAHSGSLWLTLALSGSLWLSLAHSGYLWLALRPSGRLITKERLAWPHIFNMFCCKTVEYDSVLSRNVKIRHFLSRNVKIRYFLSQNVKIHAMSRKIGINCATSWLRILFCSVPYHQYVWGNVHNIPMWQNAKIDVNAMKMHRLCFGLCQKQLFDLFLNINSNI